MEVSERRCVIISAGEIRDYVRAREFLRDDDFLVFCDGALGHAASLGVAPDLIVGDFDSCAPEDFMRYRDGAEVVRLPCEKDDSDTFAAVKIALSRGFDDFLLLGATGARFDHTFANISVLFYLDGLGKSAVIADDYSLMRVAGAKPVVIAGPCSYFSVIAAAGDVRGVRISGAKYPLDDACLKSDFQLGLSNEVLPGCAAQVSVGQGRVLVVEVV